MMFKFILFILYYFSVIQLRKSQSWPGLFKRGRRPLPIQGAWSSWQEWEECYLNSKNFPETFYKPWENLELQFRKRECDAPKPLHGGEDCKPPSRRFRQCSCENPLSSYMINSNRSEIIFSRKSLVSNPPNQALLGKNYTGWCSKDTLSYLQSMYLQVNFVNFVNIGSIETSGVKGGVKSSGRITQYKLQYSIDGNSWTNIFQKPHSQNDIFRGNFLPKGLQKNKFDTPKVVKSLRLYPIETYGLPCLKIEIYGCVFTCGSVLENANGNIAAQSSVEIDQNCLWKIQVKQKTSLTFDFIVFNVLCEYGQLAFHDGDFPFNESPLLSKVCLRNEEDDIPLLKLNRNSIWLNFISNSSSPEIGFNLKYLSECSQIISLVEGKKKFIQSPNYPDNYFDNLNCTWEIFSPASTNVIDIFIKDFDVESSSQQNDLCNDDFVIIRFIKNDSPVEYGKFCNGNPINDKKISISTEKLIISFKSNKYLTSKGFSFQLLSGSLVSTTIDTEIGDKKINPSKNTYGTIETYRNGTNVTVIRRKVKKDKDDTWTIIIISTFSAFCFVLLCIVVSANIKRFINNRNEVNAHCAKLLEEKNAKKTQNHQKLLQHLKQQQALPLKKDDDDATETDRMLENIEKSTEKREIICNDGPLHKTSPIEELSRKKSTELSLNETCPDGVDEKIVDTESYDSSSPQIHSPMRTSFSGIHTDGEESIV